MHLWIQLLSMRLFPALIKALEKKLIAKSCSSTFTWVQMLGLGASFTGGDNKDCFIAVQHPQRELKRSWQSHPASALISLFMRHRKKKARLMAKLSLNLGTNSTSSVTLGKSPISLCYPAIKWEFRVPPCFLTTCQVYFHCKHWAANIFCYS